MRGQRERSGSLFSCVSIEERNPASNPLRRICKLADQALDRVNPMFCKLYAAEGRPSVPPELLLRAFLLQAFCGSADSEFHLGLCRGSRCTIASSAVMSRALRAFVDAPSLRRSIS